MLILIPVLIRINAIKLHIGCAQFPINEVRLDHVPRFLPGTYSVNPANKTTSNAPNAKPCNKRKIYKISTFGERAAPIITIICTTSYKRIDFFLPILSPIGPPISAPNNCPIV